MYSNPNALRLGMILNEKKVSKVVYCKLRLFHCYGRLTPFYRKKMKSDDIILLTWSHGCWIYNYLCNQCRSSLALWGRTPLRWNVPDTALCDKVCQWLVIGRWFSPGAPVSSTNKTDRHDFNWNIVESGVKHHNSTPSKYKLMAL